MVTLPAAGMLREVPPGYIAHYVIDASVALKWVLTEDFADQAARYARGAIEQRITLTVPSLFWYEIANTLRYAKPDPEPEGFHSAAWQLFQSVPLHTIEFAPEAFLHITELAGRHGITVYDGAYVFLAQSLQVPLVTADRRLAQRCADLPFVWLLQALVH